MTWNLTNEQQTELTKLCLEDTTTPATVVAWLWRHGFTCSEDQARRELQGRRIAAEKKRLRHAEKTAVTLAQEYDELEELARWIAGEHDTDPVGTLFVRWLEVHMMRNLKGQKLPPGQLEQCWKMVALRADVRASIAQPAAEQRKVVIPQGLVKELFKQAYGLD